jgi:uncharacterized protein
METAAGILATALALALVVVLPIRGYFRYQEMKAAGSDRTVRARLMRRSTVIKWSLLPIVGLVWLMAGGAAEVWWWGPYAVSTGLLLLAGTGGGAILLARRSRSPQGRAKLTKAAKGFAAILPITKAERRQFVGVALTAGIVEEVLYRAFLIGYLHWLWPSGSAWSVLIVAGIAFGLIHIYQGWRGWLATTFLGIVFGACYLTAGLIVVVVVHTLIDLRLLLLPPDVVAELVAASEAADASEPTTPTDATDATSGSSGAVDPTR